MEIVNQVLSTYGMPLNRRMSLTLKPADKGVFDVVVDGQLVFSRGKEGRFPTFDEIKKHIDPKLSMQIEAPTA
jgi:selT/selW/selH-like putative selenoprotein